MSRNSHRLRKLVDGAFDWLARNLELFDPFTDGTKPDMFRTKAMLELACMCMHYYRRVSENRDARVQNFVSFVHDVWQRPDYQQRVVRNPESLRFYAMAYIALLSCGTEDRFYCEVIQRVVDQGYATAVEELPYRAMDLRHMLDCSSFKHNLPSYDYLYKQTLLAKTPPVSYLTDDDVYSITHTLFYLSDFGLRPIEAIPEEQLPTVRWMVATLLGIYLRLRNSDLVAELLLSCRCLHWSPPYIFDIAWNALLDAQLTDGSVLGPTFSKEEMQQLSGSEQKTYCFEQNYHTTLVSALACFLSDGWITNL